MNSKLLVFFFSAIALAVTSIGFASDTNLGPVTAVERTTEIKDADLGVCAQDFSSHMQVQMMSCSVGATENAEELVVNAGKKSVTFAAVGSGMDRDLVVTFRAKGNGYWIYVKLPHSMSHYPAKLILPYVKNAFEKLDSRELKSLIFTYK